MSRTAIDADEAFALVSDGTRLSILRALTDTDSDGLSFGDLRARVDVADSGQFNYHLNRLVGTFIRKSNGGTYSLTTAGNRLVGAVLRGVYHDQGEHREFTLDAPCPNCGGSIPVIYDDEQLSIGCPECESFTAEITFPLPPGMLRVRDDDELLDGIDAWLRAQLRAAVGSLCLNCAGTLTVSLTNDTTLVDFEGPFVECRCDRCGRTLLTSISEYLVFEPAVIGLFHNHGVDLVRMPLIELPLVCNTTTTVVETDPLTARTRFAIADEQLDVTIEDDGTTHIE